MSDKSGNYKTQKWYSDYQDRLMERYRQRDNDGLCVVCGGPRDRERRKTCLKCATKQNECWRGRYHALKTMGICVRCGYRPAIKGQTLCEECKARDKQRREIKKEEKENGEGL